MLFINTDKNLKLEPRISVGWLVDRLVGWSWGKEEFKNRNSTKIMIHTHMYFQPCQGTQL